MKRWIALLLAGILLFGTAAAEFEVVADEKEQTAETDMEFQDETELDEEDAEDGTGDSDLDVWLNWVNPYPDRNYEELVVGNPTPMDGKFFTGMWGNATSDIDVRSLVHGYYLTMWGYETGLFVHTPNVVSGMLIAEDPEGNRTYTLSLCDDLFYSDGTKITAWDYAFAVLFQAAPEVAETGGLPMDLSYLKGYEEYISGESKAFEGVHVKDDHMIEFTVKHEYLPYFFELYRLCFCPFPIREILPGCKVYDDGDGCYIANEDPNVKEKIFTSELLQETVMDPEFGYLAHPTVGSGPYVLTSWDQGTFTCTFEINPYFKGDWEGNIPTIPKLRYTLAHNEDMVDLLRDDEFQLLNKVTRQDSIMNGMQLVGSGLGYSMSNYPRIGLTFIVFTPDRPCLQEMNVRKAINYCFEKEETVDEYTGGFGLAMDGLIGLGQWMYQMVMGSLNYPVELPENPTAQDQKEYDEKIEAWDALSLDGLKHYSLNVEEAVRLLEENEWTLNKDGQPFQAGEDEYRCKEVDGELEALDLTCAYPETNITAESLLNLLVPHLAEAGIKLTLLPLDMKTLLRSYNDKDIEDIDLFYLGDDFNVEFDPQLFFQPGDPEAPFEDTLAWVHAQMYEYARLMCETEPTDAYEFVRKWIIFQEHLSDYLPMIPVYTNVYFDFYTSDLTNYDILKYITWGDAIVPSSYYNAGQAMADMVAEERAAAEAAGENLEEDILEEELGEDEASFED